MSQKSLTIILAILFFMAPSIQIENDFDLYMNSLFDIN